MPRIRTDEERRRDRERKRLERALNTPYAQRVREGKRSEGRKARRRELRKRPEQRAKEAANMRKYRQNPMAKEKNRVRKLVNLAIKRGDIVRPKDCELCGSSPGKLPNGRAALRADHYAGYDKPLIVRFVCPTCDGRQERERGNTVLGKKLAKA